MVARSLAATVAIALPFASQGTAINLVASMCQAALALTAGAAVAAIAQSRWAGWVIATYVVLVPVGPETSANIANLQWFMLAAGCLVAWWLPMRRTGRRNCASCRSATCR